MAVFYDTKVLWALGASDDLSGKAHKKIKDSGYDVFVTNTPLIELADLSIGSSFLSKGASKILKGLRNTYGIRPVIVEGVANGVVQGAALKMMKIFNSLSYHDALAITEVAGVSGGGVFVTWQTSVLKLDQAALAIFLKGQDLHNVTIASPLIMFDALSAL